MPPPSDGYVAEQNNGHANGADQRSGAEAGASVDPRGAIWVDDNDWKETEIPKRPWVVPGYALRGAVTLVSGPPSALKSSLMLAWSCAVALRLEYGQFRPTEAGVSIVYNVEDNRDEQRRRLSAVLRQFNAHPRDIRGKVVRIGPNTIGTLLTRDPDGKIRFTSAMQALETLIQERRPALVIVDPLSELHNCEENDNQALRLIIATFRDLAVRYNVAVVILHHTRKGAPSPGDPDSARGASSIMGAVRVGLTLGGMLEADAQAFGLPADARARSNFVRLDDAKSNYAPIRDAQWFEKVAYVLDNGETVPAAVPWTPPAAKVATPVDLAALVVAIKRGAPDGQPWSPKLSGDPRSIRQLLGQHGFAGTDLQNAVLGGLRQSERLVEATFRNPARHLKRGLRIDGAPAVEWQDAPHV